MTDAAWAEPGGDAEWGPTHGGPGGDASAWDEGNNGATTSFNDFDDASASAAKKGDNSCRNCGQEGHFARECTEPRVGGGGLTGECYNCGEVGHNKADCPNPRVDRPFTGTCRHCNKEGHRAAECPDKAPMVCRICNEEGHRAKECKAPRMDVFASSTAQLAAHDAWEKMMTADHERDMDDFKEAFFAYAKALLEVNSRPIDLPDLEKGLRQEKRNVHLIAKERELDGTMTIVGFDGLPGKKYMLMFSWSAHPKREKFSAGWPASPKENLERLTSCGVVMESFIPKCENCGELGHIRKHCKEEPTEAEHQRIEVKCVICNEIGHRARDCTNERVDPYACRNCKKAGHTAAECTEPRSAEGVECKRCNQMGHFAKDCPESGSRACRNCGQEGHISKECTEPRNPATMTCRNCDEVGHVSRDCPKPRDYSKVQCRNCGEYGHTIVRCKKAVEETNGDGGFGNDNGGFGNGGFGANGSAPTNGTTGFETNAMDVNDGGDNKSGFGGNPEFDGGW